MRAIRPTLVGYVFVLSVPCGGCGNLWLKVLFALSVFVSQNSQFLRFYPDSPHCFKLNECCVFPERVIKKFNCEGAESRKKAETKKRPAHTNIFYLAYWNCRLNWNTFLNVRFSHSAAVMAFFRQSAGFVYSFEARSGAMLYFGNFVYGSFFFQFWVKFLASHDSCQEVKWKFGCSCVVKFFHSVKDFSEGGKTVWYLNKSSFSIMLLCLHAAICFVWNLFRVFDPVCF